MEGICQTRPSAEEMDETRALQVAYQYLCHLEEAKLWLENVLKLQLPQAAELEENLRNGVLLARIGNFVAPKVVPLNAIYDPNQIRYVTNGLNFRHTDNINLWLRALQKSGFPRIFLPEVPDVFERKNMPKVIYCIHALSAHLFRLGAAPCMQDLFGKVQFTDDTISNVLKELKESGVVMPVFQKISQLFSQEIDPVGNTLKCAVDAVNCAIDHQSTENLMVALSDTALQLKHLNRNNVEMYLDAFTSAKEEKCKMSVNKSLSESYEADECDDILTQPEIQGHIRAVNLECFWSRICSAMSDQDFAVVELILEENAGELGPEYEKSNGQYYIEEFQKLVLDADDSKCTRQFIYQAIRSGNTRSSEVLEAADAIKRICVILEKGNHADLMFELKRPCLGVKNDLNDFAAPLYFCELSEHFLMTNKLTLSNIVSCISTLNLVATVTVAVDTSDANAVWDALTDLNDYIKGALALPQCGDLSLRTSYLRYLELTRNDKFGMENDLLTLDEIEDCIDSVNDLEVDRTNKLAIVQRINIAVKQCNEDTLMEWLPNIIQKVLEDDSPLWMLCLTKKLKEKLDEGQELWLSDIIGTGDDVISFKEAICHRIQFIRNIKQAVHYGDICKLQECLYKEGFERPLNNTGLETKLRLILEDNGNTPWIKENINGEIFYINADSGCFSLKPPELLPTRQTFFTDFLKDAILQLNEIPPTSDEELVQSVVRMQAYIRGYLVRKNLLRWRIAAVIIQRWWRKKRCEIQKADGERFMDYYLSHMEEIKTIQDCWRKRQKRKATTRISPEPSCKSLNQSVHCADAAEELIQKVRCQVMEAIKNNQELSKRVEDMDTKIGLLVRNRISIAALMAERKSQKLPCTKPSGIKSLCKEAKMLLDGYQKLFYLLQTRPEYLSRLITQSPSNPTIQSCIFNLFNLGSSPRDAYLLLRLFARALKEEVSEKFRKPTDAVTGNPLVLKLAVGFARQTGGQHPLQFILAPLIYRVLEDTATLDTNPIDIYRRWLNETEASSGCASILPRNVSQREALTHPEVELRLQQNINLLKTWVKEFLTRLAENTHKFPYALKYIAKTLSEALKSKFPEATEKDLLKIVGHLIYYQYINSALVAPDAFHIISLPAQQPLRAEQRKNLASIAKILQFSASKNGFGEESQHLMQLNPFIIECHDVMKQISRECCMVPSLEERFHVSQFSEALLLRKPRVYMTVQELCECHNLLIKQRPIVAPEACDPLHELLDDLREVPTPASLLGCTPEIAANIQVEKTLICFELNTEFLPAPGNEKLVMKSANDDAEQNLRREAQTKELHDLKVTLGRLHEKTKHFEEQIVFYEKYLETCLSNLTLKKKNKSKKTVKYTGAQLIQKGILANLESVPANQLKNVQFEISSTAVSGRFQVRCRFMGVEVDTADIDIQHLLSLQFEGCGVMNMFGKAEVNVNLLIFLLNKKFIGQNCKKDYTK